MLVTWCLDKQRKMAISSHKNVFKGVPILRIIWTGSGCRNKYKAVLCVLIFIKCAYKKLHNQVSACKWVWCPFAFSQNELETRRANITKRGGPLIMGCKTPLPMFSLRRQQVFDSHAETRVGRTSGKIEFLPVDHERQTTGDICHVKTTVLYRFYKIPKTHV